MPNISLFKATKDKKIQFDKFQMQKQPTVPVYLAEAGFTVALGEQTNLHLVVIEVNFSCSTTNSILMGPIVDQFYR